MMTRAQASLAEGTVLRSAMHAGGGTKTSEKGYTDKIVLTGIHDRRESIVPASWTDLYTKTFTETFIFTVISDACRGPK